MWFKEWNENQIKLKLCKWHELMLQRTTLQHGSKRKSQFCRMSPLMNKHTWDSFMLSCYLVIEVFLSFVFWKENPTVQNSTSIILPVWPGRLLRATAESTTQTWPWSRRSLRTEQRRRWWCQRRILCGSACTERPGGGRTALTVPTKIGSHMNQIFTDTTCVLRRWTTMIGMMFPVPIRGRLFVEEVTHKLFLLLLHPDFLCSYLVCFLLPHSGYKDTQTYLQAPVWSQPLRSLLFEADTREGTFMMIFSQLLFLLLVKVSVFNHFTAFCSSKGKRAR